MDKPKTFPQRWILLRGLTRSHFHCFNFKTILKDQLNLDSLEFPELPGNGYLSRENSPENLSACVLALKKQVLAMNEPVGLIGISMGGMIATQWALDFPNEVDRLILINSSFSLSPPHQRLKPKNYWGILKCLLSPNAEAIEKFIFSRTCNTENWKQHFKSCVQFQNEHRIRLMNFIRQIKMTKQSYFTQKPDCHVTVLASLNDQLVSHQCSATIARQWKVPIYTHPTAGHDLLMDDGAWIIDSIKKG